MSGAVVRVEGLEKRFTLAGQEIPVLNDLNFAFASGDTVAVMGRSGSGKSTLLHILGLLEPATGGEVYIDDVATSSLSETRRAELRRRKIGFVFQAHNLLPEHTALDNVALPVRLSGYSTRLAKQRAEALLDIVGLGNRLSHQPGELSGGEQQRVALARALVMGPSLVLADEPTGNLDPETAEGIVNLMLRMNQDMGATLVVVTHSHVLANQLPRRMMLGPNGLSEIGS